MCYFWSNCDGPITKETYPRERDHDGRGRRIVRAWHFFCIWIIQQKLTSHIRSENELGGKIIRVLSIVLVKLAYYTSSSAQNFWKLCRNYASFSKLCCLPSKLCYLVFKQNNDRKAEQGESDKTRNKPLSSDCRKGVFVCFPSCIAGKLYYQLEATRDHRIWQ